MATATGKRTTRGTRVPMRTTAARAMAVMGIQDTIAVATGITPVVEARMTSGIARHHHATPRPVTASPTTAHMPA
jgi:hypothetical protein